MATDPYRYFRVEARELLDQLSAGLLALEKDGAGDAARLLRAAHTLKGAARVVRQGAIADLTHGLEDLLAPLRAPGARLERTQVDVLLRQLDRINAQLALLPIPGAAAPPAKAALPGGVPGNQAGSPPGALPDMPPHAQSAMRQETARDAGPQASPDAPLAGAPLRMAGADLVEVDTLLQGLGEIGSELAALRQALGRLEHGARNAARLPPAQLAQLMAGCERAMAAGVERIDRELRQARDAAERLRLAPVGSMAGVLERCARDAAVSQGKQVHFEAHAGALRVDGFVLDQVQGALVQVVRNAVAHGIESEAERRAAGKPPAGRVVLEAFRDGGRARFRCSDDGRGIDLDAVRGALARAGAAPAELAHEDAGRLLARLFRGGVSTRADVTELAGRGIGLDVVRAALERLNGTVRASTGVDGTVVELDVPLTLASLDVLQVEAGGRRLALPLDAVRATLRITPELVLAGPDGDSVSHAGQVLPLLPLQLDGMPAPGVHGGAGLGRTAASAVVLAGEPHAALAVTRLAGIDTVVLQPPPPLAAAADCVMGVYFGDDGAPGLVLDPAPLAASLLQARGGRRPAAAPPLPILVVDDSLTTRMLESSILESAGFDVAMASSAEEGLEMAARRAYGLILVDVEMPGMDGFGFLERIQADPALRHIPCMLVTSRDAPEDRRRGSQAGARGHIVKSEFDQADFLGRVRELVLS